MRVISVKKFVCATLVLFILFTCYGCRQEAYLRSEYYPYFAIKTGLVENKEDAIGKLIEYDYIKADTDLKIPLNYSDLADSFVKIIGENNNDDPLSLCQNRGYFKKDVSYGKNVRKEDAVRALDKLLKEINNPFFDTDFSFKTKENYTETADLLNEKKEENIGKNYFDLNENKFYVLKKDDELYFEELDPFDFAEDLYFSSSRKIDFAEATISYPNENIRGIQYVNPKYKLLSSNKLSNVIEYQGYRISYSFSGASCNIHLSKKNKQDLTVYGDLSVFNITPHVKIDKENGKLKQAHFRLDFNTREKFGITRGKYQNYYFDFKDSDGSGFLNKLKPIIRKNKSEDGMTITLARIKTPIPDIPFIYLNMDLKLHIYAGGRAEILISNSYCTGFEIKNNQSRLIFEDNHKIDPYLRASLRTTLGINFNLEALKANLADIEMEGGIEAFVKSTLHLFDSEGKREILEYNDDYQSLYEIARKNEDVKVCGDVSLNWLLNLSLNNEGTWLNKLGFTEHKTLLDKNDQIFGNKHHIENGHFVEECSVENRKYPAEKTKSEYSADRIELSRYALVVALNSKTALPIKALPTNYNINDLDFSSSDAKVVKIENKQIIAVSEGTAKINIVTSDKKYSAQLTVLVSKR